VPLLPYPPCGILHYHMLTLTLLNCPKSLFVEWWELPCLVLRLGAKKKRFFSCALWCGWVSSRSLPFCLKYGFLVAGEGRVGYTGGGGSSGRVKQRSTSRVL